MRRKFIMLLLSFLFINLSTRFVFSESPYSIKQMTPEVSEALESRKARYNQLREFKSKGIIGENNEGYVEALEGDGAAQDLADAENRDRKVVYQTIADQNNLSGQIGIIEKVFAEVQRDKAAAGDKIQNDSGSWLTK